MLIDTNISVSHVSVDSISTDSVRIAVLDLLQDGGLEIRVSGLSLPTSTSRLATGTLRIDEIAIDTSNTAGDPASVSSLLTALLNSPDTLPIRRAEIGKLIISKLPEISNLSFQIEADNPSASFFMDEFDVSLAVTNLDGKDTVDVRAITDDSIEALLLSLAISRDDDGYQLEGSSTIRLAPWMSVFHRVGILPESITSLDATLAGPVSIGMPDDAELVVPAFATLKISNDFALDYQIEGRRPFEIEIASGKMVDLTFVYPTFDWAADLSQASLNVKIDDSNNLAMQMTDLVCVSGIFCNMRTSVTSSALSYNDISIGSLDADTGIAVTASESVQIEFSSDSEITLSNIRQPGIVTDRVVASGLVGSFVTFDDDGWDAEFASVHVDARKISLYDGVFVDVLVNIADVVVTDNGTKLIANASVAESDSIATISNVKYPLPALAVELTRTDDELAARMSVGDAAGGFFFTADLSHDSEQAKGELAGLNWKADFSERSMTDYTVHWPYRWDLVNGNWQGNGLIRWEERNDEWHFTGAIDQSVSELAGKFDEIAFDGFSSSISASTDEEDQLQFQPARMDIALLDVGVPLESLRVDYHLDASSKSVLVNSAELALFGGAVSATPFVYRLEGVDTAIGINLKAIQLQFMVDLAEFENLKLTGSVSGMLPLTLNDKRLIIEGGALQSDPPGGSIRYGSGPGDDAVGGTSSDLGLVSRALGNFQFDTLSSTVDYDEGGDLMLQMRIEGVSPDMDPTQPVILNLGVENNVPDLLRSLQATRSIADILEKRVNKP